MKNLRKVSQRIWDRYFMEAQPWEGVAEYFYKCLLESRNEAFRKSTAIARAGIDPEFIAKEIEELMK